MFILALNSELTGVFFSFQNFKGVNFPLAYTVYHEKYAVIFIFVPLYVICFAPFSYLQNFHFIFGFQQFQYVVTDLNMYECVCAF